ncbi:hypothetical protein ACQKCL_22100 [Stutzerimonas stutzeri]
MRAFKFLLSKNLWLGLGSVVAIVAVGLVAMTWGVSMVGSIEAWQRMLEQASPVLFVWRCLVYAAMVWCWLWLRRRVIERDPSEDAQKRLRRVEVGVGLTIVLFELVKAGFI